MNPANKNEYQFEYYEKYFGEAREVIRQIEECPRCRERLVIGHSADLENLLMHETAHCIKCDFGDRRLIHVLN